MAKQRTDKFLLSFESTKDRKGKPDTFARITDSLLLSEAWQDLKPYHHDLYMAMRQQNMGKRKPNRDYSEGSEEWEKVKSDLCFYFPRGTAERYCKRYVGNHSRLYKDIDDLIEHGFIDSIVSGKSDRSKNVYSYSDRWHHWKKPP